MKLELAQKIKKLIGAAKKIQKNDSVALCSPEARRLKDIVSTLKNLEWRIERCKNYPIPLSENARQILDYSLEELAKLKKEINNLPNNLKFQVGV